MKNLTTETIKNRVIGGSGDRGIGNISSCCHPERAGAAATASRRIPGMSCRENAASGSSHETFSSASGGLRESWRIIVTTLREIFDESAYERFLARTHSSRSIVSYREFLREREAAIATRPRCC